MEGWWCVRHGDALPWVEAPSATAALRRSLDLHSLGDCTDDACKLVVFPQDTYPENAGRHDYNRAVLNARRARAGDPRVARSAASRGCSPSCSSPTLRPLQSCPGGGENRGGGDYGRLPSLSLYPDRKGRVLSRRAPEPDWGIGGEGHLLSGGGRGLPLCAWSCRRRDHRSIGEGSRRPGQRGHGSCRYPNECQPARGLGGQASEYRRVARPRHLRTYPPSGRRDP